MAHIYIHYPYCLYKCHYCDFNSYALDKNEIARKPFAELISAEIQNRARLWQEKETHFLMPGRTIASIFFGGGTPSLMDPANAAKIIAELAKIYKIADDCEITLEANPGTLTADKLKAFAAAGINRLSLGLQSLDNRFLKDFGRIHDANTGIVALEMALASPIKRVSADFIFGFPGQSLGDWEKDLAQILTYSMTHLSCYALTAEEGTRFASDVKIGRLQETDGDLFSDMLQITHETLGKAGLPAYEISNFAKPGFESQHNLGYWNYHSYLGLGPGAVSQFFPKDSDDTFSLRDQNIKGPDAYAAGLVNEKYFTSESINKKTAMTEFLMMGLRLREGILLENFAQQFEVSLFDVYSEALKRIQKRGLARLDDGRLKPTQEGLYLNHKLILEFMNSSEFPHALSNL
jgi:oxygen-independent coproporphyrinogen-3 oxidase